MLSSVPLWNWAIKIEFIIKYGVNCYFTKICLFFLEKEERFCLGRTFQGVTNASESTCLSPSPYASSMLKWPPEKVAKSAKKPQQSLLFIPKYRTRQFPKNFYASGDRLYRKFCPLERCGYLQRPLAVWSRCEKQGKTVCCTCSPKVKLA